MRNLTLTLLIFLILCSCSRKSEDSENQGEQVEVAPVYMTNEDLRLLVEMPEEIKSLRGATRDEQGNIYLSAPDFSINLSEENGSPDSLSSSRILILRGDGLVEDFYVFGEDDMHPETGHVGPVDVAWGPDGHLYVVDMQTLWDEDYSSRILRIRMRNGKPVDTEVVVEGLLRPFGLIWKGDHLLVTESALVMPPKVAEGIMKPAHNSGLYAFSLSDLRKGKISVQPFTVDGHDDRLLEKFLSSNRLGMGASGIDLDEEGNVYVSILEDAKIFKISFFGSLGSRSTGLLAYLPYRSSADGIAWSTRDSLLFVTDVVRNAIHVIDKNGHSQILHQNGDTDGSDGSLDQPCDVILRNRQLIIVNMDSPEFIPGMNTKADGPSTLSVIDIHEETLNKIL